MALSSLDTLPHHLRHIYEVAPHISVTLPISLDKLLYFTQDVHNELLQLAAESIPVEPNLLLELRTYLSSLNNPQVQPQHQPAHQLVKRNRQGHTDVRRHFIYMS